MTAEQVAANLTNVGQRLVEMASGVQAATVNKALCGGLILWLTVAVGEMAALFIPSSDDNAAVMEEVSTAPKTSEAVDVSQIQSLQLFGEAGAQPVKAVVSPNIDNLALNAAKTKLNLSLEGIVHAGDRKYSLAIIVAKGKQDQYAIGDKLPAGNNVTLAKVLRDHVILDNAGRYESLWLYDDDKKNAAVSTPRSSVTPKSVTDNRRNQNATGLAKDYRERLYKNPSSLAEVLRISPAQKNGEMIGYRVSAGRDRKQFADLGFKTNDVVTSINGIDLNEPSKALEVYKLMRTAKEASFTVDRNGQSVDIMVSLGE